MRSVAIFAPSAALRLGKSLVFLLLIFGFSSPALAQDLPQVFKAGTACAGTYNPNLSCNSNDIEINDVSQMTVAEGGQPPIASCLEGETVTLDIKLTTLLNASGRYDSLFWVGENGQNPRGTAGTCYVSSLPDDPNSPFILDLENDPPGDPLGDQCNDTNSSGTTPVEQYIMQVDVLCIDQYTPDLGGDPDDVLPVPDGQLDIFALVTWFQNNTLDCGIGEGFAMEPGVNPKCDAALLLGIDVEVLESATIQVVKNSSGGEGAFDFTTDVPGLSPGFTLDTTGTGTASTAVIQLDDAEVGLTYSITEIVPAGWSLASATCSNGDDPSAVTPLDEQDVICTFNNVALGSVSVIKETIGGDGSFDFTTDLPGGNFSRTTTAGVSPAYTVPNVPAGVYSIVETVPAGWDLTDAYCSDGSDPAALDVAEGETVTCYFENTARGTIIVEKQTLPDGSLQGFTFTGDAAGTITDGQQIVVGNLVPGTYTSQETVPAGWVLDSILCDDVDVEPPLVPSTGDVGTATATFNLDPGETVTCVFTNIQDGTIEVVKDLSATGPAVETFNFTSDFNGLFSLTGHGDSTGPVPVAPGGPYSVSEDDPTADGWANVGASCDDGSDPSSIAVSPGEAVVCTFTNTPLGSATIIKETIGGNDTFLFEGDAPIGNFPLTTVGGTASTGNLFDYILAAGSYDVVETPIPAGWQLTAVDCVDGGLPGSSGSVPTATATLDVELAETVTCTFENTADGTLIIRKEVLPEDGVTFFDFTGDAAGSIRDYSSTGDELSVSGQPGIYASAETVPAGWELTDISCTGMTESTVDIGVGTAAFEPGDTNVSVDLAAGETVICTFENTAQGSITIEKLSVGGTGVFTFNTDFDGSFPLDTAGQNPASTTFSSLMPGSYTISEVVPMGWTLGDIQCSGNESSTVTIGAAGGFDPGDVGVTIDLVDGESVNCQFVNSAWGNIVVEKQTDPDGSAEDFGFTTSYGSPFSLTDGQTNNSGPLEPTVFAGTYSVAEDAEAGWDLTSATCDDGSDPSAIDLGAGETVTCTFTNTIQRGEIIVQKVTDPDTSQMDFEFITNYDAPFFLGHLETNNSGPLLPTSEMDGPYEVTETLPPGWNLDSATCDNGDLPSAITLDPGETVTCTFTNSILRGNIVVDKVTDPAGSAQPFDFTLTGTDVALAFALTDAAMPYDSGDLLPTSENGPYNVSETLPAGWNATSASCDDGSDPAAVDLAPGETVTCTFTNTIQRGNIVVDKVTVPADSPQSFDFTLAGTGVGQAFALTDTAMPYDSGSLLPTSENGTYNVSETLPPNWYTASATCDDGSEPANIDLAPGETVTCTFTNAQLELVPVPVNNPLALLLMVLGLLATGWYFRPRAVR